MDVASRGRLNMKQPLVISIIFLFLHTTTCHPVSISIGDNTIFQQLSSYSTVSGGTSNNTFKLGEKRLIHDFLTRMFDFLNLKEAVQDLKAGKSSPTTCLVCKFGMAFLKELVEAKVGESEISNIAETVCTRLQIESQRVCQGVAKLFVGEVNYIFDNLILNPLEICGFILGDDCASFYNPFYNWTVAFPPIPKPPVKPVAPPKPGSPVQYVLQLSDTHFDPYYSEGSNADCGEPLCCRTVDGVPNSPNQAAGKWGDYRNCDLPFRTMEHMLQHINRTHKVDYILWTGDVPPHDIWNTTRNESIYVLHAVTKLFQKYLPGIPVYPALGNHESAPVNSFPIPEVKGNYSISWLYDEVAKVWAQWLPSHVKYTVTKGAYYSVKVSPGLRIISVNMNYCNNLNWWILLDATDPAKQLQWLIAELQLAELVNDKVYIIGHIPPGNNDCLRVWSHNYYRIVDRYESTIVAQFFGHTHNDEFSLFYDVATLRRPTSIAYISPSMTTYVGLNPGYRIYIVDGNYPGSSRAILDHQTFITNLTMANTEGEPVWTHEYSAKDAFNMTSLLPQDWNSLVKKFKTDDTLFQLFYRYYNKMSDYRNETCFGNCKSNLICRLQTSRSHDNSLCL